MDARDGPASIQREILSYRLIRVLNIFVSDGEQQSGVSRTVERQTRAFIYEQNGDMHPSPVMPSSKRAELT